MIDLHNIKLISLRILCGPVSVVSFSSDEMKDARPKWALYFLKDCSFKYEQSFTNEQYFEYEQSLQKTETETETNWLGSILSDF